MNETPDLRIRTMNQAAENADGAFVLYWMIASRRTEWNFGMQRAVEWAKKLRKPLVVFEPLRCGYRWASDRLHWFVMQGMRDNARRLSRKSVLYFPYLESKPRAGRGLLRSLASRSCVVVSDDFPCFFLPRMARSAARQIDVRFELVDSNGILPMRSADKVFARAHDFRRFLQKNLQPHLLEFPEPDPLSRVRLPRMEQLPSEVRRQWPAATLDQLTDPSTLNALPIDHEVPIVQSVEGGSSAGQRQLRDFLDSRLSIYDSQRNQPQQEATSGLSPYLHFGHVASHEIFDATMQTDEWNPRRIAEKATGSASGWWGASAPVEAFLDELITWREVGFNMCSKRDDYDQYDSLPQWARTTLAEHAQDERKYVYSQEQFEAAETHDELWNAAQRQLGASKAGCTTICGCCGAKKMLEWSEYAASRGDNCSFDLNNKYSRRRSQIRTPTAESFGALGRYDRAWGPERLIFMAKFAT